MAPSPLRIFWFRQDLRLSDNPALSAAVSQGTVLPIYIHDDSDAGDNALGSASRWWLHHSLTALDASLGGKLAVYIGSAEKILPDLIKRLGASTIYWNRCYEPWRTARDSRIKDRLKAEGIEVQSFNGSLLWEPWDVKKDDGTPYKVFTPFYRRGCMNAIAPREPLTAPHNMTLANDPQTLAIEELQLLPRIAWDNSFIPHWQIGEKAAQVKFYHFLDHGIHDYKHGRDFPASGHVSRLSPHLHFGEVSPNQLWHAIRAQGNDVNRDHFCSELGWREFSYHLLYHVPNLPKQNLQRKFDHFPWKTDTSLLESWQQGKTGYPMVDAGMRELWQTGYMHNRVRMIVGSFLVKNLLLDWRHGERWFWDCLLDADLANNSASWQWVGGSGADAAPYFRIFNPITQGQKFDPDGHYVRRFLPELAKLPNKYLFCPWEAPDDILHQAGVVLGDTYPRPIVDIKASRERALKAFASIGN